MLDIEDVPKDVQNEMEFVMAESIDEVLAVALRGGEHTGAGSGRMLKFRR